MVEINIIPYSLRILKESEKKKNNKTVNFENLDKLKFIDFFKKFLEENKTISVNKEDEKIFYSLKDSTYDKDLDCYYGEFYSGHFGTTRPIIDTETKKRIGELKTKDADEIKFYYILKILNCEALFIVSKFKTYGIKEDIKTELSKSLVNNKFLSESFDIKMNVLVTDKLFNIENFSEVEFIQNRKLKDIESNILDDLDEKDDVLMKDKRILSLVKRQSWFKRKFIDKINSEYKKSKYIEFENVKYQKVKLVGKTKSGKNKRITINGDFNMHERQEIEFEGDFPSLEDFYLEAKDYLKQVGKEHYKKEW